MFGDRRVVPAQRLKPIAAWATDGRSKNNGEGFSSACIVNRPKVLPMPALRLSSSRLRLGTPQAHPHIIPHQGCISKTIAWLVASGRHLALTASRAAGRVLDRSKVIGITNALVRSTANLGLKA